MNIVVTGASGFIGSKFIKIYGNKFNSIVELNSKTAPLNDYIKLAELTKDTDVLVHTAFDHNYKQNIVGIKNILNVCRENSIKKLVYISTVSVYNPDYEGMLSESTVYSTINDPYSKEKRRIEKIIDNFESKSFDIIILQPSIVYGIGGNWTKYALHVCKSKSLLLPNRGEDKCNIIYVDDIANCIYQSINLNIKYEKILISSEIITWKEFYQKHCKVLKNLSMPSSCNILNNESKHDFHDNSVINFIFILWFKTPLGNVFNLLVSTLKKIRANNYENTSTQGELSKYLNSDVDSNILTPLGITKKVHACKFQVDTSKAKEIFGFALKDGFNSGIEKINEDIKKVLL